MRETSVRLQLPTRLGALGNGQSWQTLPDSEPKMRLPKLAARFERVRQFIHNHAKIFARQGRPQTDLRQMGNHLQGNGIPRRPQRTRLLRRSPGPRSGTRHPPSPHLTGIGRLFNVLRLNKQHVLAPGSVAGLTQMEEIANEVTARQLGSVEYRGSALGRHRHVCQRRCASR